MKKILRKKEVREITGLSDTTLWRLGKNSGFPRPLRLGSGSIGWLAEEIEKWIEERAAERTTTDKAVNGC